MIPFVIASHGEFAEAGLRAASMIMGSIPDNFHVLSVYDEGNGIDEFEKDACALANELGEKPVLILTDIFGGSPFMILLSAFRSNEYKVISGFNLPMLIEAMSRSAENLSLDEMSGKVIESGKENGIRLIDKIQSEGR